MPKQKDHLRSVSPLSTRSYERVPTSVDVASRSFEMIIATETPVRTIIKNPLQDNVEADDYFIEVDEVLLASGLDLSRAPGMPLVDTHATYEGLQKLLGKITNIRVEGTQVLGLGTLNSRNADLVGDIADGFYNQISAGFCVNAYELEYRDGDVPLAFATSWTLHEASLVPVGADPNASVRSLGERAAPKISIRNQKSKRNQTKINLESKPMDELDDLITAAEDAVTAAEEAVVAVEDAIAEAGDDASDETVERARKLRAKREELAEDEDDKAAERKRGKREDDELTKEEEDEIRSIRSIARSYGLQKSVDDLVKLGARAKEVKAAVRSAVMKKGMSTSTSSSDVTPQKRSAAAPVLDTAAIYARRNAR